MSNSVTLTRLDQSGFLLEVRDHDHGLVEAVALDLYLSDHLERKYRGTDKPHDRLYPPPLAPSDLAHVGWVFASHRHSDHLDPGSIGAVLDAAPWATLVLPAPLLGHAVEELGLPVERVVGVRPGEQVGPLRALPAAHPEWSGEFLSVLVELDGLRIFHSGDTVSFPELTRSLADLGPDVVLLPANGRVAEHLGTPPNMTLEDAVDLARASRARLLVPHHYDLFAFNSRSEVEVRAVLAHSGVPHRVMVPGETLALHEVVTAP